MRSELLLDILNSNWQIVEMGFHPSSVARIGARGVGYPLDGEKIAKN